MVCLLYFSDPVYCASGLEESRSPIEFQRHPEDTGESTIRLVSLDKKSSEVNGPICDSGLTISGRASEDWSTCATVGVKDESEITSMSSHSITETENSRISIGSLRNRIQDTIALYRGSSNSTMLGEIGSQNDRLGDERANNIPIETQQAREQGISSYRAVLLEQARLTRDPERLQYLGGILQELRQVAIDSGLEVNERPLDVVNERKLSIQTNPSDTYNLERRREIVRENILRDVDKQLDLNHKYSCYNNNKLIEIKSKIISIYNKYHISGKRRLFWLVVEKYTDNYDSYDQYKESGVSDTSIRKQVKCLIKDEVQKLVDKKNYLGTNKDVTRRR